GQAVAVEIGGGDPGAAGARRFERDELVDEGAGDAVEGLDLGRAAGAGGDDDVSLAAGDHLAGRDADAGVHARVVGEQVEHGGAALGSIVHVEDADARAAALVGASDDFAQAVAVEVLDADDDAGVDVGPVGEEGEEIVAVEAVHGADMAAAAGGCPGDDVWEAV